MPGSNMYSMDPALMAGSTETTNTPTKTTPKTSGVSKQMNDLLMAKAGYYTPTKPVEETKPVENQVPKHVMDVMLAKMGVRPSEPTTPVAQPATLGNKSASKLGDPYTNLPEVYKTKAFDEQAFRDSYLAKEHGAQASKRDIRRTNKFFNSEEGKQAIANAKKEHDTNEHKLWSDSVSARRQALTDEHSRRVAAAKAEWDAAMAKYDAIGAEESKPETPKQPAQESVVKAQLTPRSNAEWQRIAKENGFADMGEVMAWQEANGLEADGKFGKASAAFFKSNGLGKYQKTPEGFVELSRQDGSTFLQRTGSSTAPQASPQTATNTTTESEVKPKKKNSWFANATMAAAMADAPAVMTASGWRQNEAGDYVQDREDDPGVARLRNNIAVLGAGTLAGTAAAAFAPAAAAATPAIEAPASTPLLTGPAAKYQLYDAAGKLLMAYKTGGTMNRINYFQQGGAAPQQDMQQQVVALVQAAMQGDQKATQTVNQIMEAAKAGDQQAMQIAQLMEQVIKQMQGQATAAKWGAKLNYLQSLKCGGKTKAKKKEQGGKVCPECEKQLKQTKKSLITKHQAGGAVGFYRNWTKDEVRKLQNKLAAYGYYEGDLDGIVGSQTIAAVKKFQTEHGVKADGMWGKNTNTQKQFVDWETADKGTRKPTWQTEQGSLRTYDVAGKKMKENDYYKAINNLKEQFYDNPEAFWNAGGDTAKWREHLYTTPEGTAIMEEFYGATPDDVKKKLGNKVTNRKMQQAKMNSTITEGTDKVADVAVRKVLPTIALPLSVAAAPLATATGLAGAAVGGYLGGETWNNLHAGDERYNYLTTDDMGNTAVVVRDPEQERRLQGQVFGAAVGGAAAAEGSQYLGKPGTRGMAGYRRTNNSAPERTYRSQRRIGGGRFGKKGHLGDGKVLDQQVRLNDGTFGFKYQPTTPEFQAYLEGAGGNPSYTVVPIGMKNGGNFPRKKYFI